MAETAMCIFASGHSAVFTGFRGSKAVESRLTRTVSKTPAKWSISNKFRVTCSVNQDTTCGSNLPYYEFILKQARLKFREEVAFRKQDQEISLAKAMLLISTEDEAFISLNREKDRIAACTEGRNIPEARGAAYGANLDEFPLAGKTVPMWLAKFDFLATEVRDILAAKGSSLKPAEVLRAVNAVLFEIQGFKRSSTDLDLKSFYLHLAMTLGSGSVLMLTVIYMEICRRLGLTMKGAEVGGEVLVWPLVESLQECFEHLNGGKSWFTEVVSLQHQSHLLNSSIQGLPHVPSVSSAPTLKVVSYRDIVGMALTNLKILHWKDACKARPGLALTDPLHPLLYANGRLVDHSELAVGALLRPQNLRLALMASERLLLLQPHNWSVRRDHGLLLYHSRRYGEAVQQLSICMAFAPTLEAQMLEHFVEKLHLLRVELLWSSVRSPNTPSTLA